LPRVVGLLILLQQRSPAVVAGLLSVVEPSLT
jgi:hypothetical protein